MTNVPTPLGAATAVTGSSLSPFEAEAVRRLFANGESLANIAKTLNRPPNRIYYFAKRNGFLPPTKRTMEVVLPTKTLTALNAAAARRNIKPPDLAAALLDGVLRRGSIDKTLSRFPFDDAPEAPCEAEASCEAEV